MLQNRFQTVHMNSSGGIARFSNREECYSNSQWSVNILSLKLMSYQLQGLLFMLEIPFDADEGWLGLLKRFSTGEEGCYCEDCVVKDGGGHGVGYHVYGNGGNEEAIY